VQEQMNVIKILVSSSRRVCESVSLFIVIASTTSRTHVSADDGQKRPKHVVDKR